ncbi:MAG: rhomboid family intramembrane serine protease [Deltaproteobacteria bacterium]|nr:rhomboid family intramembrane serine protease [Deltaproteobacteria bacterium]
MSRSGGQQGGAQFRFGPTATPQVIKHLLIATAAVFVLQRVIGIGGGTTFIEEYGALQSTQFFRGMLWQPLTRLFLHSEFGHLAGNLFILWMFGSTIAQRWGYKRFLWLYMGSGVAGGLVQVALEGILHLTGWDLPFLVWGSRSLGASGAVYTVMAVFALTFPKRPINLLFIPFEFDAIWLIPMAVGLELGFPSPGVSHEAHLIGLLLGWVILRLFGDDGSRPLVRRDPKPKRPSHLRVVGDDGPIYH